jgi:hypothetical protein
MKTTRPIRATTVIAAGAVSALLAGGTYALAAGGGTIHACASKRNGALRLAHRCLKTEKRVSWNAAGPPGAQGQQGVTGPAGPFPSTLPSGKTLVGSWGLSGTGTSTAGEGAISFTYPLASAPSVHIILAGGLCRADAQAASRRPEQAPGTCASSRAGPRTPRPRPDATTHTIRSTATRVPARLERSSTSTALPQAPSTQLAPSQSRRPRCARCSAGATADGGRPVYPRRADLATLAPAHFQSSALYGSGKPVVSAPRG